MSPELIYQQLKKVKDPELGLDIVSLGLIYKLEVTNKEISILMTMTFPGCPYGPQLVEEAKKKVAKVALGKEVKVAVTFDPPWDLKMITTDARLYLGLN